VKILIRGGMSPFDNFSAAKEIIDDTFGANAGNMVYLYSVYRILMTEKCDIDIDYYKPERGLITAKEIDEINEKYDIYIIPLADAFRSDFTPSLKRLTKFIEKLKIKVVVIGSGMKIPIGENAKDHHEYDDVVKKFVRAVLKRSAVFGVRGGITEGYLRNLGFSEKEVRAIGCPSLYYHGAKLNIRSIPDNFSTKSRIIVTNSIFTNDEVHAFMRRIMESFENSIFVPQLQRELRELYYGLPYRNNKKTLYPINIGDEIFRQGRARFFLNVPTWIEHNSKADLSVGPRLHGNIASLIGGTPALIVMKDGRMQELVEFHNLTHISISDIKPETDFMEMVNKVSFDSVNDVQETNFRNFVSFLKENGIESIYDNADSVAEAPFDRKIAEIKFNEPIEPLSSCGIEEIIKRCNEFYPEQEKYMNKLQKDSAYRRQYERFIPDFITDEDGWLHKLVLKKEGYKS